MKRITKLGLLMFSTVALASCEVMPYFYGTGTKVAYKVFKQNVDDLDLIIRPKAFVTYSFSHKENGAGTGYTKEIEATWDTGLLKYLADSDEDQLIINDILYHVRFFATADEPPAVQYTTYSYYINPFRVVVDSSISASVGGETQCFDYHFNLDGWVSSLFYFARVTYSVTEGDVTTTITESVDVNASVKYVETSE